MKFLRQEVNLFFALLLVFTLFVACSYDVPDEITDTQAVAVARNALEIGYANGDSATNVTQNITLTTTGTNATTISWTSTTNSIISNDGTVTRPGGATSPTITLTASISKGTSSDTKVFNLIVKTSSFITTWETTSANVTITVPTTSSWTYDYIIDWGDGSTTEHITTTTSPTHTFATAGTYTVAIWGTFPQIYFNNSGSRNKITSIKQWGTIHWASMNSAFKGCNNLVGIATDKPDLSGVTDMSDMFNSASVFNQDIGDWDTSSITNMNSMFRTALTFNQDIGDWDTSSVSDMNSMFAFNPVFNQDISSWTVTNVKYMQFMFYSASAFANHDLSSWHPKSGCIHHSMFTNAGAGNIEPTW